MAVEQAVAAFASVWTSGSIAWLLWKRFLVRNSEENKFLATSVAQVEVINMLKRLSDINVDLAAALNELQRENVTLNKMLTDLQKENANLKSEIAQLHMTLHEVKDAFINKLKGEM